jgi:hypothetical protein
MMKIRSIEGISAELCVETFTPEKGSETKATCGDNIDENETSWNLLKKIELET